MTTAMINKLLHAPIAQLKSGSDGNDEASLYIAALRKLFDLEGK
jgi:glutamyl-tRNA reductase